MYNYDKAMILNGVINALILKKCGNSQNSSGNDGETEIRKLCSIYPRLVGNIKMKDRSSKGKQKPGFKWHGSLEQLKDFVSLVLKKKGTWKETKRKSSSTSFKTANLSIIFYRETKPLQLQGNKAQETLDFLLSMIQEKLDIQLKQIKGSHGIPESKRSRNKV